MDNLVRSSSYTRYDYKTSVVRGCPNLTELTLPNLTTIYGRTFVGVGDYTDIAYSCKAYIDQQLQYYRDRYPSSYQTNSGYITWYERRFGGTIDGTLENAAPYNTGKYSSSDYNMQ